MEQLAIAYDIDTVSAGAGVQTVYNRIKACLRECGFSQFVEESIYAIPQGVATDGMLQKAILALSQLQERKFIKRLHSLVLTANESDILCDVDDRTSAPPDKELRANELLRIIAEVLGKPN